MTMEERFGDLTGLKVAWVGDGNNMANSWITAAMHLDFALYLACPPGYEPDAALLAQAQAQGARVYLGQDPEAAVAGAQVINTDVWASMGQEDEAAARQEVFKPYQVNSQLMKNAPRGHRAPLPAGPPGRGNHRRGPGRPPKRGLGPGGKPPALPEGAAGVAAGERGRGANRGEEGQGPTALPSSHTPLPTRIRCQWLPACVTAAKRCVIAPWTGHGFECWRHCPHIF